MEKQRSARESSIRAFLVKNSALTKTQLAAVLSYVHGEHTTSEANARRLSGRRVSKGAFHRSLTQARRNIEAAVYTLTLLTYEGVIGQRDIDNITIVGNLLQELAESLEAGEIQPILDKSEAIMSRTVKKMTERRM